MIAEVIVDVAAYPIDRPFDYIVPEPLMSIIEPGARVKVPFGPRKVIGYITKLKEESDLEASKLRPIHELVDLEPVLTNELLGLSKWLAEQTLSYEIDAMQVMLPAAMRAKYEKFIIVNDPEAINDIEFTMFFAVRNRVTIKKEESHNLLAFLKVLVEDGCVK